MSLEVPSMAAIGAQVAAAIGAQVAAARGAWERAGIAAVAASAPLGPAPDPAFGAGVADLHRRLAALGVSASALAWQDLFDAAGLGADLALRMVDPATWLAPGGGEGLGEALDLLEAAERGEAVSARLDQAYARFDARFGSEAMSLERFFGFSAEEARELAVAGETVTLEAPTPALALAPPTSPAPARDTVIPTPTAETPVVAPTPVADRPPAASRLSGPARLAPELTRLLGGVSGALAALAEDPAAIEPRLSLRRVFHRLAGDARQVGVPVPGDVAAAAESCLAALGEAGLAFTPPLLAALADVSTWLLGLAEHEGAGLAAPPADEACSLIARLAAHPKETADQHLIGLRARFAAQAAHALEGIREALVLLGQEAGAGAGLARLGRLLHTLKGDAGMVEAPVIVGLCEHGEDFLERLTAAARVPTAAQVAALDTLTELLGDQLPGLLGQPVPEIESLPVALLAPLGETEAVPAARAAPTRTAVALAPAAPGAAGDRPAGPPRYVVLDAGRLEEAAMLSLRGGGAAAELGRLLDGLGTEATRLLRLAERLPGLLPRDGRAVGTARVIGDVSELERLDDERRRELQLGELVGDLLLTGANLREQVRRARRSHLTEQELANRVGQRLLALQVQRVDSLAARLDQVVRATARLLGKRVDWRLEGGDVCLARDVLDALAEPLTHLLRNAIDHGLEKEAGRLAAGKPPAGRLSLVARPEGAREVSLVLRDDGRGLAPDRLRDQAVIRGLLTPEAALALSDREALELIWERGFSTAPAQTSISGRGMGMAIVREVMMNLGGAISLESVPGQGSAITLRVPAERTLRQVLLARAGSVRFALPTGLVRAVHEDERALPGGPAIWVGEAIAMPGSPLFLEVASPRGPVGYAVDEIVRTEEALIRAVPGYLAPFGWQGAVVDASGLVWPVLDPAAGGGRILRASASFLRVPRAVPVVLVVDDSVLVRQDLQNTLHEAGYQTEGAADADEALAWIARHGLPSLITLDLEMPGLTGLELLALLRALPGGDHVPAVIISTRAHARYHEEARRLGAVGYLTKPYEGRELLGLAARAAPLGRDLEGGEPAARAG